MTQQVFIPVTDDLMFDHPERIEGPLVPYFAGMECHHWLSIEINPEEDAAELSRRSEAIKPRQHKSEFADLRLAYSA